MTPADHAIDHAVAITMAQGMVTERLTEGHGTYRSTVLLLDGPWGQRAILDTSRLAMPTAHEIDGEDAAVLRELHERSSLYNAGAVLARAIGATP